MKSSKDVRLDMAAINDVLTGEPQEGSWTSQDLKLSVHVLGMISFTSEPADKLQQSNHKHTA